MIYSCHSAASRVQLSMRAVDTRDVAGRFANKKIMHRASSVSRTASMKVGYLYFTSNSSTNAEQNVLLPLFNDMVQAVGWLVVV